MDEESESRISTSSSSVGIPPDSPGDGGHYGDDEPVIYETVRHFPGVAHLDHRHGYVKHVGQTEAGSNSDVAGQGVGEGTRGHHGDYVGQQGVMYGRYGGYSYDSNWVPPSLAPLLSIKQMLIEKGRLDPPPYPERPFHTPHTYFMLFEYSQPSQSTGDQDSHHPIKSNLNTVMGMGV